MEPTFGSYTIGTLRKTTLYRVACENRQCKVQPIGFPHHNAARARSNWNTRYEEKGRAK